MTTPTESTFELATIQRLQALGYRYLHGSEIDRPLHAVVLEGPLREALRRRYAHLPAVTIEQAIQVISAPEGATLDRRNMAIQHCHHPRRDRPPRRLDRPRAAAGAARREGAV